MNVHLNDLKNEHKMFTQTHISDDETFIFGLDSLHFQYASMNFEYDTFIKQYAMIRNRMYCENYKLHKLIVKYVNTVDSIHDISSLNDTEIVPHASAKDLEMNNEPYDDLDAFKEYNFDGICELYTKNIDAIQLLNKISKYKSSILTNYISKQSRGVNVNNFVISFDCEIKFIESRIMMFNEYVKALTDTHTENISHLIENVTNSFYDINKTLRPPTPESESNVEPIPPPLNPPLPTTKSKQNSESNIAEMGSNSESVEPTVELSDFTISATEIQPEQKSE